jgi:hypothetical protein
MRFVLSHDAYAPGIAEAFASSSLAALQVYGRLAILAPPGRQ